MNTHVDSAATIAAVAGPDHRAIVATHLGAPDAEQIIIKTVRANYRRAHPALLEAESLSEESTKQLIFHNEWRDRQLQEMRNSS